MEEEIHKPVNTFTYRDITLSIYIDDYSQCLFTILPWENRLFSFGSYNADYEDCAKYLIDEHLDVITRDFGDDFHGACLRWFDNAGYRDIKLEYRQRILKIFIVSNIHKITDLTINRLKKESEDCLKKLKNK